MRFSAPLIVVEDIERSRAFYEKVLCQNVILDFGENITFEGDFSLQSAASWQKFIGKNANDILKKSNNFELYFEEDDFEAFLSNLKQYEDIEYVHSVHEYPWGQKVIRFYDPDKHMIEVGENMRSVVKRFLAGGMSPEQAAERSQFPLEFIISCIE